MERFFSKSFLNEKIKLKKILHFLESKKIDVMFVQQATDEFCFSFVKKNREYRIIRGFNSNRTQSNCAIIIKESSFEKAYVGRKGNLKFLQIRQDKNLSEEYKVEFLKWKGT